MHPSASRPTKPKPNGESAVSRNAGCVGDGREFIEREIERESMKLEIESTSEIVAIDGVPCRKWNVKTIDGLSYDIESHVFTRLLLLPKALMIEDPHIMNLSGPYPPKQSDLPSPAPELEDTAADDDEPDN